MLFDHRVAVPWVFLATGIAGGCGSSSKLTGACNGGETRSFACGYCGTETDTCVGGAWTAGPCLDVGVCEPGATRQVACGTGGSETDTCSLRCQWRAAGCVEALADAGPADAGLADAGPADAGAVDAGAPDAGT